LFFIIRSPFGWTRQTRVSRFSGQANLIKL
jgi:hypothetical protein